jgi:hypothetical protein
LYEKLGLKYEVEKSSKAREEACDSRGPAVVLNENGDEVPDIDAFCDWTNLIMCLDSRYKEMRSFRLAMRKYAISNSLN